MIIFQLPVILSMNIYLQHRTYELFWWLIAMNLDVMNYHRWCSIDYIASAWYPQLARPDKGAIERMLATYIAGMCPPYWIDSEFRFLKESLQASSEIGRNFPAFIFGVREPPNVLDLRKPLIEMIFILRQVFEMHKHLKVRR